MTKDDKITVDRLLIDAESMATLARLWLDGSKECLKMVNDIQKGKHERIIKRPR